jgi:hypothetical protein
MRDSQPTGALEMATGNCGQSGRTLVCAVALMLGQAALAADAGKPASGLASALEQAWRLHPQAAALDARDAEAQAARDIAGGLTPEPGAVSIGSRNDRWNRDRGKQEYEVELATPLWLPGQKAAREDAAERARIDEVAAKRIALRWELAGELREAWWALAAARNARALAARRVETARALESDVRRRYRAGDLSRIDGNLAQSEVLAAEAELIEAEANRLQAEQVLRTLTGGAPVDIGEEAPAPTAMARLTAEANATMATHPLLAAAAAAARSPRGRGPRSPTNPGVPRRNWHCAWCASAAISPSPTPTASACAEDSVFLGRAGAPRDFGGTGRGQPGRRRNAACAEPCRARGAERARRALAAAGATARHGRRSVVRWLPTICAWPKRPSRWANPTWRRCCASAPPPSTPKPFSAASASPAPRPYRD